ncbi:MAG: polyketide cyclase / dehydrase and lipid transport [Actinomycetes bacterium]
MPLVDLMDETFIVVPPATLAARLRDPEVVRRAWPGLDLVVFMDRADAGIRWSVTGQLVGSCEIWLEPFGDGVIVHYFLRADPTRRGSRTEPVAGSPRRLQRRAVRIARAHATSWKAVLHALKDELEDGRPAGEPPPLAPAAPAATPNGSRAAR